MIYDDSEPQRSSLPDGHEPRVASALVLMAEPDPQRRALYTQVLQEAGYEVVSVRSAATAMTEAAQLAPDLIIAQLSEPTADGFALCRKLRAEADTRHTPVLVLTRFDDPYTREQIVRAGATAILIEPMRRALLVRQVRRLLARTRAHAPLSVGASPDSEVRR
jgi:twitching motility two-component system response regulator PilH